ncbi:hypothetical protein HU200_013531 [Digitaria exilis]|uniref:Uncharacterized protein n=1 Tax=Digitaria exilis TaxID=1010633 RepID=A0A835FD89_9POAL|nr:hypothetical protein HU200_013531 [Digitaria exilis]
MLRCAYTQRRWAHRRGGFVTGGTGWSKPPPPGLGPAAGAGAKKSEWWAVDGEMHEIGDGVPHRERFAIPRDNLPNRRRKQMREQFMRRTRLVLKDSEHDTWCKKYMELYQELRETGKGCIGMKVIQKRLLNLMLNYDSAEEDDLDFSAYSRKRQSNLEPNKNVGLIIGGISGPWLWGEQQGETWERVTQIRDKFEYDRERRMRERGKLCCICSHEYGEHFGRHDQDLEAMMIQILPQQTRVMILARVYFWTPF